MNNKSVVINVFSNWSNFLVTVCIAFLISPIIVHSLGIEIYGVWTLIVSVTSYFTVLDFGVNTAIVRYISGKSARKDYSGARSVYSTSLAIFFFIGVAILIFSLIFGYFFQDIFRLHHINRFYIYTVFLLISIDLASGLVFSVFLGSLVGLQEFRFINGTSIIFNILKSIIIVLLMVRGYGLLTLALIQILSSFGVSSCRYVFIRKKYSFLKFERSSIDRKTVKLIYDYSIYSFVIAISFKLLYYTDSIVIGSMIGLSAVTYFAIPSTLVDYLGKFLWAMIAVLVPIISANEQTGEGVRNQELYVTGTKYTLMVGMPVIIVLYFFGEDFIRLWMGAKIGEHSRWVLRILLIGYTFSFSQLIAHGILKGISKHRVLAYILSVDALSNLLLSLFLAKKWGIEGVAFGTMLPMLISSVIIIIYSCRVLNMKFWHYIYNGYIGAALGAVAAVLLIMYIGESAKSYMELIIKSMLVSVIYMSVAVPIGLKKQHREMIYNRIKSYIYA